MGKLLLTAFAVVSGLVATENRMSKITINPDPPVAGASATITYRAGARLRIEYTPGGVETVTCRSDGTVDIVVAGTAQYMLISDASNSNVSSGYTVSPPVN